MNKFLGIVFLFFFSLSCSSNLDFNQVQDLKLEPILVANLATFEVQANQFVIGGIEQNVAGDVMNFDVFKNSFFNDSLTRADLFFEFNNTINRAFKINLYFLDANNKPIYTIPFDVPANTANITKTEIFETAKLDTLKKTVKVAFSIIMPPGVPVLNENSLGSIKLSSSCTLYFIVE